MGEHEIGIFLHCHLELELYYFLISYVINVITMCQHFTSYG